LIKSEAFYQEISSFRQLDATVLKIEFPDKIEIFDLGGDGSSHAGGDEYVVECMIHPYETLDKHPNIDSVFLSTEIALIAEEC